MTFINADGTSTLTLRDLLLYYYYITEYSRKYWLSEGRFKYFPSASSCESVAAFYQDIRFLS